tara:strand:- start:110 stop:241 length:132 start_codon:yes stop_codon:yes gene_type:complete
MNVSIGIEMSTKGYVEISIRESDLVETIARLVILENVTWIGVK